MFINRNVQKGLDMTEQPGSDTAPAADANPVQQPPTSAPMTESTNTEPAGDVKAVEGDASVPDSILPAGAEFHDHPVEPSQQPRGAGEASQDNPSAARDGSDGGPGA